MHKEKQSESESVRFYMYSHEVQIVCFYSPSNTNTVTYNAFTDSLHLKNLFHFHSVTNA